MPAAPSVTFDLWHTLVYLPPEEEGRYMDRLTDAAVDVLESAPVVPGRSEVDRPTLRARFEAASLRAVEASREGRAVTPERQIQEAGEEVGRRPAAGAYDLALERLLAETSFRVEPTALDVLRALREAGYRVGLISNTVGEPGRLLRPVLHRFGLDQYLEALVFSDEHPWAKPAPEIFRAALTALGSEPALALHVGDGWPDLEGARRAGLRGGILFTGLQQYAPEYEGMYVRSPRVVPPTAEIARLPELLPLVRALLPRPEAR